MSSRRLLSLAAVAALALLVFASSALAAAGGGSSGFGGGGGGGGGRGSGKRIFWIFWFFINLGPGGWIALGVIVLRIAFTVAPILFGLDKFLNVLVDWPRYPAPSINDILPGTAQTGMDIVGVIEIVAGLVVAVAPRFGAPLVAAWLGGIIVNLLTYSGYYDIALRDFGLMLAALTLTRLAWAYDRR